MEIDDQLSQALAMYLGLGRAPSPQRDSEALKQAFGAGRGDDLQATIGELIREMGAIPIDWNMQTLQSGTALAENEMRSRYPELDDQALKALAWDFAYSWK